MAWRMLKIHELFSLQKWITANTLPTRAFLPLYFPPAGILVTSTLVVGRSSLFSNIDNSLVYQNVTFLVMFLDVANFKPGHKLS